VLIPPCLVLRVRRVRLALPVRIQLFLVLKAHKAHKALKALPVLTPLCRVHKARLVLIRLCQVRRAPLARTERKGRQALIQ